MMGSQVLWLLTAAVWKQGLMALWDRASVNRRSAWGLLALFQSAMTAMAIFLTWVKKKKIPNISRIDHALKGE